MRDDRGFKKWKRGDEDSDEECELSLIIKIKERGVGRLAG